MTNRHKSDWDHSCSNSDSSAASTSSGEIDCEIVDNNSSEEEIDEQSHESALLRNQSDPSSSSQSVPSSAPTETGSDKTASNYFILSLIIVTVLGALLDLQQVQKHPTKPSDIKETDLMPFKSLTSNVCKWFRLAE